MGSRSEIHSVLFDDKMYTTAEARKWLKKHNLKPIKIVHHTENYLRYRIKDPSLFKSFITKEIKPGIKFVIGFI